MARRAALLLLTWLGGSSALRLHALPHRPRAAATRMVTDPAVLQSVAVYDSEMEAKVQDLTARLASAEAAKADVAKALETKTAEVEKFVDSVEAELTAARESVKTLTEELKSARAELEERTTEVGALNQHLEAHTGATLRYKKEVEELQEALALAAAAKEAAAS